MKFENLLLNHSDHFQPFLAQSIFVWMRLKLDHSFLKMKIMFFLRNSGTVG